MPLFLFRRLLVIPIVLCALLWGNFASAQQLEQEFQLRVGGEVEKEIVDDFSASLAPEVRTVGLNPDRYLLELGLKYDPLKYLSLRTGFRGDLEEKNSGLDGGYRFRFDVVGKMGFGDFEPNARLRYQYEFGPNRDSQHSMRYKLGLDYEIDPADLTVGVGVEAFQDLGLGSFYKMRYGGGLTWDFYKSKKFDQSLGLNYNFDYFLDQYKNVHIVELTYGASF